jgi:hypothetical protein
MAEAMQNASPEERAAKAQMMQNMSGAMMAPQEPAAKPQIRVSKTSKKTKKNGYACVLFEVYTDDVLTDRVWATKASNIPEGAGTLKAMEKLAALQESLAAPFGGEGDSWMASLSAMGGHFPIAGTSYEYGQETDSFELISARKQKLDKAMFEPPKGYQLQSFTME